MCGIAGIITFQADSSSVDRDRLRVIRDHMTARGPDARGEWFSSNGRVALGHRRLSIIDLSDRSTQPMIGANGQLVITFNGEIYNYRQLKKDLEERGCIFRTKSDTEVLLHLYAEKREAMLKDLRGMYAFAIWDTVREELFLARDPFGIKPLYYADAAKTFRFASQVKALLAGGQIDTAPEPAGHAGFFLWGSVPEPWTLYRGIRSLPAGHFMKVSECGSFGPTPFCLITEILSEAVISPATRPRSEALEAIGTAVRDSVRAHQVSDVPVGLFLSSGLDSAMIGALASSNGNHLRSLTLSFKEYAGTANDETPMAEKLAELFHSRHSTVSVRQNEFEEEREKLLAAMDQPSIDGVNTWFVARAAAEKGMKVALSGVGGDELFGSYPSFRDVPRLKRMTAPFSGIPGLGKLFRWLSLPLLSRTTSPKYAGLLEYGTSFGGAYLLRRALFMHWELSKVLDPDLARQGWQDLQMFDQLNRVASSPRSGNRMSQGESTKLAKKSRLAISALEMTYYMRNQLLRDTDWAGMAHSLEIRVPLVDIDLLCNIAPWLAAYPDLGKTEVASAIVPHLPPEVLNKPKTGFLVPVREWLLAEQLGPKGRGLRGWAHYMHQRFAGKVA